MTSSTRDYPSKVLLFGEYSILVGSCALAHPLAKFSGHPVNLKSKLNHFDLQGLYSYLEAYFSNTSEQFLDLKSFGSALKDNWCFDSNIPIGKGLGSSGALCAAIFDQFKAKEVSDESSLREYLGAIESYFHDSSSGMDPLISLNERSYIIQNGGEIKHFNAILDCYTALDNEGITAYLVDSGVSRQASPFVKLFKKKLEDQKFRDFLETEYLSVNSQCLNNFTEKNVKDFRQSIGKLSELQQKIFPEMFLKEIQDHSRIIKDQNLGRIKLCGAGGGGFYVLFSYIGDDIRKYFPNYSLLKLKDYL